MLHGTLSPPGANGGSSTKQLWKEDVMSFGPVFPRNHKPHVKQKNGSYNNASGPEYCIRSFIQIHSDLEDERCVRAIPS